MQKDKKYSESDNNFAESIDDMSKDVNDNVADEEENDESNQEINEINEVNKVDEEAENEEIKKKAKETYIQTDFFEKVIKYVKTDNLIRKETIEFREKINTLKEEKQDLENFILRYLDVQEENVININGSGKLTKYESVRKKGINKDIIQQAICDQIKKEKLVTDDKKLKELAEETYNIMEGKREKTVKTVLKRTFIKEKKAKAVKEKVKKESGEKPKKIKKEKAKK